MAIVTEYLCSKCNLELVDDERVFIWDEESNETRDFMILMRTCQWMHGAKIRGDVNETYCSECDRYLKVYSIRDVEEGIENPCMTVEDGIKNYIARLASDLVEMKEAMMSPDFDITQKDGYYEVKCQKYEHFHYSNIFNREMSRSEVIEAAYKSFNEQMDEIIEERLEEYGKYLRSNYLIIDDTDKSRDDYDPLEKVKCPVCGKKTYKYVSNEVPCPRCGGKLFGGFPICYD